MSADKWVEEEIKSVDFGDIRLNKRLGSILEVFAEGPEKSIPNACKTWRETLAAYRFFNNESVTPSKILAPHSKATLKRIKEEEVVLIVQDTSEIDFSSHQAIQGMGPLRTENQKGFYLHPSLAITPEKLCLGVVDGHMWRREKLEKHKKRKQLPITEKESYRWLEGFEIADQIAQACPSTLIVNVADREADIYELLMQQTTIQKKAHWLIRSQTNRVIFSEKDSKLKSKLHNQIKNAPIVGVIEFALPAAAGRIKNKAIWEKTPARKKRMVKQEIRIGCVDIVPVERKGEHLPSVSIYVVHCVEIDPPSSKEKVEWFLITSIPINGIESAIKAIKWYLCRWQIEIFFKVLKSGCRIEELQFETFKSTANCVAMYMIVAWRVLYLMTLGRRCPEISCALVFEDTEWRSIYAVVTKKRPPKEPPSLDKMMRMIASLGGFLGRKGDGNPGQKVIWIGLQKMRNYTEALEVYESINGRICV